MRRYKYISLITLILVHAVNAATISTVNINTHEVNTHSVNQTIINNSNLSKEDKGISLLLPLKSDLTVGNIQAHKVSSVKYHLPTSMFIIGSDATSLQWLKANHEKLKQINAIGIVVNIASLDDYHMIKAAAGSLTICQIFPKNFLA